VATLTLCPCQSGARATRFVRLADGSETIVCRACWIGGHSHAEDERLFDRVAKWYGEGYTLLATARRLKLSAYQVQVVTRRQGLNWRRRPGLYRVRWLAGEVFDPAVVTPYIAHRWVKEGRLAALRTGWVKHQALLAFLEDDTTWMEWTPSALRDAHLAAWATELRRNVTWEWLTCRQAARRMGCCVATIRHYIQRGWLPATIIGNQHWLRSDHVEHLQTHLVCRKAALAA
jgi:hypothetical protein